MRPSIEIIKSGLKEELKNPGLSDLRCAYIIQKIKLLSKHKRNYFKSQKPIE